MPIFNASSPHKASTWPIGIGAEGITAAQFARCGFDVLVQAGRDKPWYDLVVTKAGNLLKVSIKASDDGRWRLTDGYSRSPANWGGSPLDSRGAIDLWRNSHGSRAVCCLVQFDGVAIDQLPRMYLASPTEIANKMIETVDRLGHCALYEQYAWTSPEGVEAMEMLPSSWMFSPQRIQDLLTQQALGGTPTPQVMKPVSMPARTGSQTLDKPNEIALSA